MHRLCGEVYDEGGVTELTDAGKTGSASRRLTQELIEHSSACLLFFPPTKPFAENSQRNAPRRNVLCECGSDVSIKTVTYQLHRVFPFCVWIVSIMREGCWKSACAKEAPGDRFEYLPFI